MSLTDFILDNPALLIVLVSLLYAAKAKQAGLGWHEYRTWHRLKRTLAPQLNRHVFTISEKGYRNDGEFMATVDTDVRTVWERLLDHGFDPHLVASIKRRPLPPSNTGSEYTDKRLDPSAEAIRFQYSYAHAVWYHEDGDQTEVYIFQNPDGSADVYAHHEEAFVDPSDHLYGPQTDGDPTGVVRDALDSFP